MTAAREIVLRVVEAETGFAVEEETTLEELGLDSLDLLDLLLAIGNEAGTELGEEQIVGVETVADLIRLVHEAGA